MKMNKKILASMASIFVIGILALALGYGTNAWFSDTETSSGNTFTAGTLNLDGTDMATFTFGSIGNMAPGDITGMAVIVVKNGGSIDAATFGRFTLTGDTGLAQALKFYNYKVEYHKNGGAAVARWDATNFDPYFGTAINMDYFIAEGDTGKWVAVGGKVNLRAWVDTNGPLDINNAAWDMEGLKSGSYYVLSVQFQMDPNANNWYQGKTVTLGYEVKATQINRDAILLLGLGGDIASTVDSHVAYLLSQLSLQ